MRVETKRATVPAAAGACAAGSAAGAPAVFAVTACVVPAELAAAAAESSFFVGAGAAGSFGNAASVCNAPAT